jgi:hypothetical protein
VRADEKLTAFLELESAINQSKILAKDQNSCSYGTRRDNSAAGNIANSRKVRVPCDQRTGSGIVTLELFASAAAVQPSAAALEAGLMEQEQHYLCSAVLP